MTRFPFLPTQNKIEDIKAKQAETAESLIRLQFRMEQLVYCQDQLYSALLQNVRDDGASQLQLGGVLQRNPLPFSKNASAVSSITEIGVHLSAYFSVSVGAPGLGWGV